MKRVAIFGSTGSIGRNALRVAEHLKDEVRVFALAAQSDIDLLEQQIEQFHPEIVAVFDSKRALELQKRLSHKVKIVSGKEGMEEIASHAQVDLVIIAIVGMAALAPTVAAIKSKKAIGLANKEVLVAAGEWISQLVKENGVSLIPIDSEQSAIFQCLQGQHQKEIRRVILTASGGPFKEFSEEQLSKVTVEDALKHPVWKMGPKITIDSSTLMNKGLEVIEARWLFDLSPNQIEVVIHPQHAVHGMIEFIDGSLLAQVGYPDMVLPIQYAMTYPERKNSLLPPFDFQKYPRLDFIAPDFKKFLALTLAYEALKVGKSAPCYLNAANEILVERFLKREFSWQGIMERLEKLIKKHRAVACDSLDTLFGIDQEARKEAWGI